MALNLSVTHLRCSDWERGWQPKMSFKPRCSYKPAIYLHQTYKCLQPSSQFPGLLWSLVCLSWSDLVFVLLWSLAYFSHLWWTLEEAPEVHGSSPLIITTYEPVLLCVLYLVNNILAQVCWRKELFFHGFNSCASFRARNIVTWWRVGLYLMLRLNILQLIWLWRQRGQHDLILENGECRVAGKRCGVDIA